MELYTLSTRDEALPLTVEPICARPMQCPHPRDELFHGEVKDAVVGNAKTTSHLLEEGLSGE